MIHPAIPATLLALAAPAAIAAGDGIDGVAVAQLTIHERIVIRVPRVAAAPISRPAPLAVPGWKEKKGPKCIAAADLGGAIFGPRGQVDLVMAGGRRLRARINGDCGPMDFYSGVYIRPGADGKICAERDAIRTRSGAMCDIDGFRTLVAQRRGDIDGR